MAKPVSERGSGATVAPLVAIIEMPRKYSMPASVTMKDETPIRVTQKPCQAPIEHAAGDRDRHGEHRVDVVLDGEQREDDADQRHGRADREVEIARDDQHHRADRGQADDRGLQRQQDEIALGEERAVGGEIEEQPDRGEDEEQHRVAQRRDCASRREPAVGAPRWRRAPVRLPIRRSRSAIRRHPQQDSLSLSSAPLSSPTRAAVAHDDDAVADVDQFLGVGRGEQDGLPAGREVGPDALDLAPRADIDAARRVDQDEDAGVGREPAGDLDLLLVAAGQRPHFGVDRRWP